MAHGKEPPLKMTFPHETADEPVRALKMHADMQRESSAVDAPFIPLGRIQSFGFLIALTRDWVVCRVSNNLEAILGIRPGDALGATLDSLVDLEALHDIRNRLLGLSATGNVERMYNVTLVKTRRAVDLTIHYVGGLCVLEGEPAAHNNWVDAASLVRTIAARLDTQPSLDAFHRDAARQVRSLTGFDRIIIYRFSADGGGEVIAEVAKTGMEPFLGLYYPAAEIPVQAHSLHLRNSLRIIADVHSETVPLLARVDTADTTEPLDLTLAVTRAVSTVHVEHLRNTGVGASMSISVLVDGRLWGIVACHHETAKLPTSVTRTAAELFGQMYAMLLERRLRLAAEQQARRGRQLVAQMVEAIAGDESLLTDAGWLLDVLRQMVQCDGVVVTIGGVVSASGATPSGAALDLITRFLDAFSATEIFASDNLASLGGEILQAPDIAAGILSIPISRASGDHLMLFRRDQPRGITSAGEAAGAMSVGGEQDRSVRGLSRPFTDLEQQLAKAIRSGLIEALFRRSHANAVQQSQFRGRQELLIAELNHRVRNVLSLIRGLISQTQSESGDSASYVESLNGRVQALARAHDRVTRENWGPGPLNAIFEDEIAAYVPTRRDRFTICGPSILLQPQAYSTLALIIHELVTNAAKYGALSGNGQVEVTLNLVPGQGLRFRWHEFGGPAVTAPTRRGFGSVIIERVVPFDLQGTATVSYLPAGLKGEFFIPERHIAGVNKETKGVPSNASAVQALQESTGSHPLEGLRVLLLEDNLIVALEAEDILRAIGAVSVTAVSSIEAAMKVCESAPIQFAVLDIMLGVETSLAFAEILRKNKVPFIFASGYGDQRASGESRIPELIVSKPYDCDSLRAAVAVSLARG